MAEKIARAYPSNTESEAAVLGALMTDPANIHHGMSVLSAEDFYLEHNKRIFRTIVDLAEKHTPIDVVTVYSLIKLRGYEISLDQVMAADMFFGNFEAHCAIVKELSKRRRAQTILEQAREAVFADDIDQAIQRVAGELVGITCDKQKEPISIGEAGTRAMKAIETAMSAGPDGAGIKTGIVGFDQLCGGLFETDQIVIGARPGVGKTALALTICINAARIAGVHSFIDNVEMSEMQLAMRALSSKTGIENVKLRRGAITDEEVSLVAQEGALLFDLPIMVSQERNWERIKANVQAAKYRNPGLKIVVFDFLNRIQLGRGRKDRREELAIISAEGKSLASDLGIVSIFLAQVKRETDKDKKPPTMADLRECGNIEEDADFVMFLHRNAKYRGRVDLIVAKARNAPLGDVPLTYHDERVTFTDWEFTGG